MRQQKFRDAYELIPITKKSLGQVDPPHYEYEALVRYSETGILINLKKFDEALELAYQNLEYLRSSLHQFDKMYLYEDKMLLQLATILHQKRKFPETIEAYKDFLSSARVNMGTEHPIYQEYSPVYQQLTACWEAKEKGFPEPFVIVDYENGGSAMYDRTMAELLISDLPAPNQNDLDALASNITTIVFTQHVASDEEVEVAEGLMGKRLVDEVFYSTEQQEEIHQVLKWLQIDDSFDAGHMMCIGEVKIKLYQHENLLADIEYLGDNQIRWQKKWLDDAKLVYGNKLKLFLREKGAHFYNE